MRYNRLGVIIVLALIGVLAGCAGTTVNPNYDAYLTAKAIAVEQARPTFRVECPPEGCNFSTLEYFDPRDRVKIEQKAPHPGYKIVGQVIKTAGTIAGISLITNGIVDLADVIAENAGDNYNHSFNEIAGDNVHTNIRADRGVIGDTRIGGDSSVHLNRDDHSIIINEPPEEPPVEDPPVEDPLVEEPVIE